MREPQADAFWQWMRPYFINEVPLIEAKPGSAETEIKTQEHLLFLIKDEQLFNDIAAQVAALKEAGVQEKNIVQSDIGRVNRIRIGDNYYMPKDNYNFALFAEKNNTITNENMVD